MVSAAPMTSLMPLQASTQWDGLGHIFDAGRAWSGRRSEAVVTGEGDHVTGIETTRDQLVSRGVLLDVGAAFGTDGELPDGFAITAEHLDDTIAQQGVSPASAEATSCWFAPPVGARAARRVAGIRRGASPGLSFGTAGWLHAREIAAIATDTWGFEVRPMNSMSPSSPCIRS